MGLLVSHKDSREWHQILAVIGEFDVYHMPEYHQLEINNTANDAYLYVFEKHDNIAIVPFVRQAAPEHDWVDEAFFDAISVYGYPGPLVRCETALHEEFSKDFISDLRETLKQLHIVAFFMRSHPVLTPPELLGDQKRFIGKTVSIDLTVPLDEQLASCRKSHRYEWRKAKRNGVVAIHDENFSHIDEFISIYNQRMETLAASDSYFFPRSYYEQLVANLGQQTKLVHAELNEEIIGSSLFFISEHGIQYHLSGTKEGFESLSPTRIIVEEMRDWGTNQGYRWMHLGGGVGGAEDTLFKFKTGFSPTTRDFTACQIIADTDAYTRLSQKYERFWQDKGVDVSLSKYFPIYRAPV